ncbi:MAG: hypothetical protein AAB875_05095, partial [Patescibacteria group bacterium]
GFLKWALGGLAAVGAGQIGWELWKLAKRETSTANLQENLGDTSGFYKGEATAIPRETATPTPSQPGEAETKPTPTPEAPKMVEGYILKETIDLGKNERPVFMAIKLNNGKYIMSGVANPYAFSTENEANNVFHPSKKTVYTYLDRSNIPITWMHSGTYNDRDIFATQLELFVRKPNGTLATPEEAQEAIRKDLIGATVYLFQGKSRESFPRGFPQGMDIFNEFDGNILELKIVAGARIPRWGLDSEGKKVDLVSEYIGHPMDSFAWVNERIPNIGFSNIPESNFWGIKLCSAPLKGEEPYPQDYPIRHSRLLFGLTIPENGLSVVKYPINS